VVKIKASEMVSNDLGPPQSPFKAQSATSPMMKDFPYNSLNPKP